MTPNERISAFEAAGQGQVFKFFSTLSPDEQAHLLGQAEEIDLEEIARLKRDLIDGGAEGGLDLAALSPAPYEPLPDQGGDATAWATALQTGETALRAGRVAAFTVAGGQGTRLGYNGPKGTFPVTPVRKKTLFQVFAEKIAAAGQRYGCEIPWLIMTSHQNHEATEAFFAENENFGLADGQVRFFRQGRMPAVDGDGKIMLEAKGSIAMSPDGHGGSLRALDRSGALDFLAERGVDTISYFQVDNPLVRCIDPAFLGWHLERRSQMSSKMVPKAYAGEKVGHFCVQDGRSVVVEYSDLPAEVQEQTDPTTGELLYKAGSIAIHVLDREFVRGLARGGGGAALPFHLANKKIPTIDEAGEAVDPTSPNGIKFEMFVFDALPFAENPVVIETKRANDFSPVKNAEGVDSPATSRDDQLRQFARWANAAGADLATDESGLPEIVFEVAPSFGYDEASFADAWAAADPKPVISAGTVLE
ncbi:UDPGP type 1 family protein [Synoicihabitans lomoniglobus]|uniref:UDPGP type 1 family protein n=1 Tax=Synoicihabitans lomoniglobus TaxID=2909285 RepID=A0AAF0I467_9BACT|nr:UDPGP type 1 family protein [Opitutaceae bacterium LMO-M01]WED67467.1 UDPGP type 1 family protein [Opitutaceae bacterium LMO-M01]